MRRGEISKAIRARVEVARERQRGRFASYADGHGALLTNADTPALRAGASVETDKLFAAAGQKELAARLTYLLRERGFGLVTGEIGSGKSTAVRAFTASLDANSYLVIYLANPTTRFSTNPPPVESGSTTTCCGICTTYAHAASFRCATSVSSSVI